jgi:hypothetical protein
MKLLAGTVATVLLVLALAACGGGGDGSASSTESESERDQIALEEEQTALEHNNNWVACITARTWRREDARSGNSGTKADEYMLRGAEKTCAYWQKEQRGKRQRDRH